MMVNEDYRAATPEDFINDQTSNDDGYIAEALRLGRLPRPI